MGEKGSSSSSRAEVLEMERKNLSAQCYESDQNYAQTAAHGHHDLPDDVEVLGNEESEGETWRRICKDTSSPTRNGSEEEEESIRTASERFQGDTEVLQESES